MVGQNQSESWQNEFKIGIGNEKGIHNFNKYLSGERLIISEMKAETKRQSKALTIAKTG